MIMFHTKVWKPVDFTYVLAAQSCPTFYDSTSCSPLGSSVHGILQAGTLEWVTIPPPENLPDPRTESRSPALKADSLPSEPLGKLNAPGPPS